MSEGMSEGNFVIAVAGPSKGQVLKATAVAALVAAAIFFTVVLPAEYGKDPLHTGAALGLMNLSQSAPAPSTPIATSTSTGPTTNFTVIQPTKAGDAPIIQGVYVPQPSGYKVDSRELKLGIGEGMEIKYHMAKGAGMVYSWTVSPAEKVFYEFHGEPDVKPAGAGEDYYVSYDLDDKVGKTEYHGSFTAPDTGIQGWFWENQTGAPVTIKLVTAGFYDYILQNKDDQKTKLQPSDPK